MKSVKFLKFIYQVFSQPTKINFDKFINSLPDLDLLPNFTFFSFFCFCKIFWNWNCMSSKRKQILSDAERTLIYHSLLSASIDGKLQRGSVPAAASRFQVARSTIHKIWNRGQEISQSGILESLILTKMTGRKGRPKIEINAQKIRLPWVCPNRQFIDESAKVL